MRNEMRKLSAIRNRKIKHYLALNHALQQLLVDDGNFTLCDFNDFIIIAAAA